MAVATSAVFAAEPELDEGVLVLTDENFDDVLAKNDKILIEFYAPWCGHCKTLAPLYAEAAQVLAKADPPVPLAKLDATEHKKAAEKFGIQGFPTLFWFVNGEKTEYGGGRTKDTIVSWVLKKSGPPSTEVSCAALKEKVAESKFVLAYFGDFTNALFTEAHMSFAAGEDAITFVHSSDAECAKENGVDTLPGVAFFRKFEESPLAYAGAADKDALSAWVKPLRVPTVFEFTDDDIEAVFGQQNPTLFLFRAKEDASAPFQAVFEEAAKAHKGKMLFAYSGVSDGIQERLAEFIGVTAADLPTLRALMPASMKKFISETKAADLTVENIGTFVDEVIEGKLNAHLKSEEPPAEQGNNIVITGKEFEKIVKDETKDVLVKYYAPWCGHCKKLAPIWDELADAFAGEPNVVIGKFDATLNEADGVEIQGYPTLMFYPKDNKAGVTYDGERDLESFKKWLNEKSPVLLAKVASEQQADL